MPCPPSWEERQMMRIDSDVADAERTIARALPEVVQSLAVVEEVQPSAIEDFDACLAFARDVRARGLPAYTGKRAEQRWPEQEDLDREEAYLRFRADLAARLELCLCVFGTAITCHGERTPAIERELARHRAHREREREERVAYLERSGRHAEARRVRALSIDVLMRDRRALHE